jgi:hypothetical protein
VEDMCYERRRASRGLSGLVMCVFITAVPMTKLFAWGEGDSGGHVRFKPLATVCVFITAVPITFFFIRLLLKWGVVNYTVGSLPIAGGLE